MGVRSFLYTCSLWNNSNLLRSGGVTVNVLNVSMNSILMKLQLGRSATCIQLGRCLTCFGYLYHFRGHRRIGPLDPFLVNKGDGKCVSFITV